MTATCDTSPGLAADAYRRQARRLRCRYAGQPDRLQHSLKQLAAATSIRATATQPPVVATPAARARTYAEFLSASMPASGILRYSQRLTYLRAAPRFGLNRFEANLAIAAVLARHRPHEDATVIRPTEQSMTGTVITFAIVQGAVIVGAWWTLFR